MYMLAYIWLAGEPRWGWGHSVVNSQAAKGKGERQKLIKVKIISDDLK